jgi:hypothetical protein
VTALDYQSVGVGQIDAELIICRWGQIYDGDIRHIRAVRAVICVKENRYHNPPSTAVDITRIQPICHELSISPRADEHRPEHIGPLSADIHRDRQAIPAL